MVPDVVGATTTYTITLDETFTGATGTAKARFQKWVKLTPVINSQNLLWSEMPIAQTSPWIWFKIAMRFTGANEFSSLILLSEDQQQIT